MFCSVLADRHYSMFVSLWNCVTIEGKVYRFQERGGIAEVESLGKGKEKVPSAQPEKLGQRSVDISSTVIGRHKSIWMQVLVGW